MCITCALVCKNPAASEIQYTSVVRTSAVLQTVDAPPVCKFSQVGAIKKWLLSTEEENKSGVELYYSLKSFHTSEMLK